MKRIRPIYVFAAFLVAVAIWRAVTSPESLGIGVAPDRDCRDFSSQQEAQKFFEANKPGDRHRLDEDNDGIACEVLRVGRRIDCIR